MGDVSFLPAAQVDYDEALAWYLKRSARAAAGFEAAVAHGVQRVADDPETYALIDKRHRRLQSPILVGGLGIGDVGPDDQ